MIDYDRHGALVPDGYRVVEGPRLVKDAPARFCTLRRVAARRARWLNERADTPLYRYEAIRVDQGLITDLNRDGDAVPRVAAPWWARWAVVARQNTLRKNDPEGVH